MSLRTTLSYIERRVLERSFWSDVVAGVIAASALPKPWNYWVAAAAFLKSLVPDAAKPSA
jgi:hypothetical protein